MFGVPEGGATGKDRGIYTVKDFNPKLKDKIVITAIIIEVRINLLRNSFTCSAIDIGVEVNLGFQILLYFHSQYNIIIMSLNIPRNVDFIDVASYIFRNAI